MKAQKLAITMKGRFRMSGFAADVAAAEQLLVAHVLTVKRIRGAECEPVWLRETRCQPVGGGGRNSPFRRANVKEL